MKKNNQEDKVQYSWESLFPEHNRWDQELPAKPLSTLIDDAVEKFPNHIAIDFLGQKQTYTELSVAINRVTKGLQKLGVKKGSKVGIMMPNCPQYMLSFFGVLKAGGSVINFNPLHTVKDLKYQIDDLGVDLMITLNLNVLYHKANNLLRSTSMERLVLCEFESELTWGKKFLFKMLRSNEIANLKYNYSHVSFNEMMQNDGEFNPVSIEPDEDIALYQYTGGTTGIPKAAMLTHKNLYTNIYQCSVTFDVMKPGEESVMAILPFFHIFALTAIMGVGVSKGSKLILHPKFELDKLLKDIHKKSPTILAAVPAIYAAMVHSEDAKKYNLSSLKVCVSGGAALPVPIKEEFESFSGCHIYEGYGLTENSPVATLNPPFAENKAGSIGVPLPGVIIEICDPKDSTKVMPYGEIGEICIQGPQVMKGYYNPSEEVANPIQNGKLLTGDLGYLTEEGYVYIVDRIKELIICGGVNIYPRKIESEMIKHHYVNEVAVIGVDDDYKGQVVKIFIVVRPGESLSEEDIITYLDGKVAKYELPKYIEFMKELPKTMIGKIDKKVLVEQESKPKQS
ncbi:MAG: long-chain fatty acid--CoA ligase [Rickettsiales bacterium]|nr:long-chain fatty acid--CoA ligase [Rickettsiales bacterium]